jgi:hypothetical protein
MDVQKQWHLARQRPPADSAEPLIPIASFVTATGRWPWYVHDSGGDAVSPEMQRLGVGTEAQELA